MVVHLIKSCKVVKHLQIYKIFSHVTVKHILAILLSVFVSGYKGKTVNFEKTSSCHRTTVAHFLNHGKWDHRQLESIMKAVVIRTIYEESRPLRSINLILGSLKYPLSNMYPAFLYPYAQAFDSIN